MKGKTFHDLLKDKFPFKPTKSQEKGFKAISEFLTNSKKNKILLIKGYAGTGKTTLIGHLVKYLSLVKKKSILLAPTGRAAKVLSSYAGNFSYTIHKKIYFTQSYTEENSLKCQLQ